ncbi:hypothetical protein Q4577_23525 [Marinovum sp. 2_MG-2023]|uniref:hypothetical protein n=1 Tax=unclassified Marinovum TaxID=2647166 RepID=UPI0026E29D7D|nr:MULTISPECIES: hypothetical protein [unclassified Marinovum]MDO6732980.1 hypothetical protein [Marinovum sp. 2_MG-2023]MDO6782246.1 hypothetical protein [Marinovum sp. 1_MG-2023]
MKKRICVHLGPHKTGSSAIQDLLSKNAETLSREYDTAIITGGDLAVISKALHETDWLLAQRSLLTLREKVSDLTESVVIISSEDFSGQLPGRSATRRVYPRLSQHINIISKTFSDCECNFYFFRREEQQWLDSVYAQNLRFRQNFSSRKRFDDFIRFEGGWDPVLEKASLKYGNRFNIVPYLENAQFSSELALLNAIGLKLEESKFRLDKARVNASPTAAQLQVLEVINGSHASIQAKKNAKKWLLSPATVQPNYQGPESVPKWPPVFETSSAHPGLAALAERAKSRVYTQDELPWVLPSPDIDLVHLRDKIVEGPTEFPGGNRQDMKQQEKILQYRFAGQPFVNYLIGFSISYLRRDTKHSVSARKLFFRAWDSEFPLLLSTLPTRWLISTLQTFIDHGRSSNERIIGTAGYFFFNTLKAYEAERALEGLQPDGVYPNSKPKTKNGFPGMDRFDLGGSDLMVNTLALLLELSMQEPVSGRVLQELLARTKNSNSVLSRMDRSRQYHMVKNPQFDNCWSFFEEPKSR